MKRHPKTLGHKIYFTILLLIFLFGTRNARKI